MTSESTAGPPTKNFNPVQYIVHRLLYTPILGYFFYLIGVQFREGQFLFFGPYSPYFPYTTQDIFISSFWFVRSVFETVFTSAFGIFMNGLFGVLGIIFFMRIIELIYQREVVQKGRGRIEARRRLIRIRYASSYYFKEILNSAYLVLVIPFAFLAVLSLVIIVLIFPTLAQDQGRKSAEKKVQSYSLCYKVDDAGKLVNDIGRCACVYSSGKLESFGWTVDASKDHILLYRFDKPAKLQSMKDRVVTTSVGKICSTNIE